MSDPETNARLANIESLLAQILRELHKKRRGVAKRKRTISDRTLRAALAETRYKPTELEIAAARKALARHASRDRNRT